MKRVLDQSFNENSPPLGLDCCWRKAEKNGRGKNLINLITEKTLVTNIKMYLNFADRFLHALRQEQHQMTRNSSFSCHSNSALKFKHKLKENDTARSTNKQTNKQDHMLLGPPGGSPKTRENRAQAANHSVIIF